MRANPRKYPLMGVIRDLFSVASACAAFYFTASPVTTTVAFVLARQWNCPVLLSYVRPRRLKLAQFADVAILCFAAWYWFQDDLMWTCLHLAAAYSVFIEDSTAMSVGMLWNTIHPAPGFSTYVWWVDFVAYAGIYVLAHVHMALKGSESQPTIIYCVSTQTEPEDGADEDSSEGEPEDSSDGEPEDSSDDDDRSPSEADDDESDDDDFRGGDYDGGDDDEHPSGYNLRSRTKKIHIGDPHDG